MSFNEYTVIDAHTHVGPVFDDEPPLTPDGLIAWMDDHAIDRAVVLPLESPVATSEYITTEQVLKATGDYPERLIPFCCLDPRMHVHRRPMAFEERIERYVERGARGFGEFKVGLPIDDDRMRTLYRIAGEYDLPVLFHVDGRRAIDDVGLPNLGSVLREFPETDFIAHTPGWWNHISADVDRMDGYSTDPVMEGDRCDELLETYNLYADTSARSVGTLLSGTSTTASGSWIAITNTYSGEPITSTADRLSRN